MNISVAITTFNRPGALAECLSSLSEQTKSEFEVVIVNGGDSLSVESVVKNFNFPIKIIQQNKKGLVEARNLCWKESKGDIICMVDDDLVVSKNWLEEVIKTFNLSEEIGGVTGPTLIDESRNLNRDAVSIIKKFKFISVLISHKKLKVH